MQDSYITEAPKGVVFPRLLVLLLATLSFLPKAYTQNTFKFNLNSVKQEPLALENLKNLSFHYYGDSQEIYLQLKVFKGKEQILIGDCRTTPFQINRKDKQLPEYALDNLLIDFFKKGYRNYFINKNKTFPQGKYTFVLSAYSADSIQYLGGDRINFFNPGDEDQIVLKKPGNNIHIEKQSYIFQWALKTSIQSNSGLTYQIQLVPVLPWQSPEQAFENNPTWFEANRLSTPQYLYNESNKPLKTNSTYAWRVMAFTEDVIIARSNTKVFHVGSKKENKRDQIAKRFPIKTTTSDSINRLVSETFFDSSSSEWKEEPKLNTPVDSLPGIEKLLPINQLPDSDVKFSGRIQNEGFYSSRPNKDSFHRNSYARTNIATQFQAFGLPLTGNALLTTQNSRLDHSSPSNQLNPFQNGLNRFNLGIDISAIQNNVRERLENEVNQFRDIKNSRDLNALKDSNALENLDHLEANQGQIKEHYGKKYFERLKKLQQLQVIEQMKSRNGPKAKKLEKELSSLNEQLGKKSLNKQALRSLSDSIGMSDLINRRNQNPSDLKENRITEERRLLRRYLEADNSSVKKHLKDSLSKTNPALLEKFESLSRAKAINKMLDDQTGITVDDLKRLGSQNKVESLLLNMESLNVGNFYAQHSPIVLSGMNLSGLNFSYETSHYHVSAAWGKAQNHRLRGNYNQQTGREQENRTKNIFAGKAGLGTEQGSHIFITFLKGTESKDQSGDILLNNYVFGLDGQWNLGDQLTIKSEVARSITKNDGSNLRVLKNETSENVSPNSQNVQKDLAYRIEADYKSSKTDTRINASLNKTGPGYYTSGVPFLRTDQLRYRGRISQNFFKRQITISPYLRREQDNLIQIKQATSMVTSYGGMMNVSFRNYPTLMVNYAPYQQRVIYENQQNRNYQSKGQNLNSTLRYSYQIGAININSQVSHTYQAMKNTQKQQLQKFNTYSYRQTYRLSEPFRLNHEYQYLERHDNSPIQTGKVSGQYRFNSNWRAKLGANYWSQNNSKDEGIGAFASLHFNLLKGLHGSARVKQQNQPGYYYGLDRQQINPFTVRTTIRYKW